MCMNIEDITQNLKHVESISKELNFNQENSIKNLRDLIKKAKDYRAKILFVGSFSAGKSALINSFLGNEEILAEDVEPMTALPTEIIYDEEEFVEIIGNNGDIERSDLNCLSLPPSIDSKKFILHLNRNQIKELENVVLVDMPGFDSNYENHNNAIAQYIDEASAYIFVIDVQNGTINKSGIDFLNEIQNYSKSIKFIITKSDKVVPSIVEEVKNSIESELCSIICNPPCVVATSSRDTNCRATLKEILSSFNANSLFINKYGKNILSTIDRIIDCVQVEKEHISYDPYKIDLEIHKLDNEKQSLSKTLENQKSKLHKELQGKTLNAILSDVKAALTNSVDALSESARLGNENFQNKVCSIVRPIVIKSVQENVQISFENFIEQVQKNLNQGLNLETAQATAHATQNTLLKLTDFARSTLPKLEKYSTLYKIVSTSLAVTTSYIAPALELVIIFLPEIIGLINKIAENSNNESLKDEILHNIIPTICSDLRQKLSEKLQEIEDKQLVELQSEFNNNLDDLVMRMENAKKEKEQNINRVKTQLEALDKAYKELEEILNNLRNSFSSEKDGE